MHLQTLDDPTHSLTWRGHWLKRRAGPDVSLEMLRFFPQHRRAD